MNVREARDATRGRPRRPRSRSLMAAAALAVVAILLAAACSSRPAATPTTTPNITPTTNTSRTPATTQVPAKYRAEYASVQSQVKALAAAAGPAPAHASTTIGVELLAANGNIGPRLLQPGALAGVEAELDAFRSLGVTGVTVDVAFPLLLPSTPNHQGYLQFYEQVAEQVRARGMVLSVEENPIYAGTALSPLSISYAGLTLDTYAAEQREQAQLIIDNLKPRYLSILTEPDTYADAIHIPINSPTAAVQAVTAELAGLQRGNTLVGAGTGTWSGPAIDRALLAQTSIDYLDIHVYALLPGQLASLAEQVAAARAAHKTLVMDETWLYKSGSGTTGLGGAANEQKLVSYSFWEPLDEQYVAAMVKYARSQGFAYMAFFDGARAFFAYLTWTPALDAGSYQALEQQYNQLVANSMREHAVTGTGLALRAAIAAN